MTWKYEYKSEVELELTYKKLSPGECKFMVKAVTDKDERGFALVNSKGNQYLKLELIVRDHMGTKGLVMENISSNASWKVKEICDALGVPQFYNEHGEFEPSALIGLQGKAVLEERSYTKRDGTTATTSSISSYINDKQMAIPKPSPIAPQPIAPNTIDDDEIPF